MRKRLLCILTLLAISSAYSYEYLRVDNPQQTWQLGQGTIEEAVISVRPQGLFTEIGLYLTFSARGLTFSSNDQLEIRMDFLLPEEAVVHDLWLWIDGDIIRGDMIDRWTAASIYNGIVNRREDPAILFKESEVQYRLQVYPLLPQEVRKVKLTYLVPGNWQRHNVATLLPSRLLALSKNPLNNIHVLFWDQGQWFNPQFAEYPAVQFQGKSDPLLGDFQEAVLPGSASEGSITLLTNAPFIDGVYLTTLSENWDQYYQMALLPSEAFNLRKPRKTAILFEHEAANATFSSGDMLQFAKAGLQQHFTAGDSFNLFFSANPVRIAGNQWYPGSAAGIEQAFADAGPDPVGSHRNLEGLLTAGVNFVKQNGNDGSLLLISSSDDLRDYQQANDVTDRIVGEMNPVLPVYIADFQDRNRTRQVIGGIRYYGNEYFYQNLTRRTLGRSIWMGSDPMAVTESLNQLFSSLGGFIESLDIFTAFQGGFSYGNILLEGEQQRTYVDQPLLLIGKYFGQPPLTIEATGLWNQVPFSASQSVSAANVYASDSLIQEAWFGQRIRQMEAEPQTNAVIADIIDMSVAERVMSRYTSLLALEPGDTNDICATCIDETQLTGIDPEPLPVPGDTALTAFPNPFNGATTISIGLGIQQKAQFAALEFRIFNVLGQEVRRFYPEKATGNLLQIIWDGKDQRGNTVASGTYLFAARGQGWQKVLRLQFVK